MTPERMTYLSAQKYSDQIVLLKFHMHDRALMQEMTYMLKEKSAKNETCLLAKQEVF